MEVETAIRFLLLADSTLNGYVVGKGYKHRLPLSFETDAPGGYAFVVARRAGGWSAPQDVNTQEYPLVELHWWADPDRDASGNITHLNAEEKAFALARVGDRLLHGVRGATWGTTSTRAGLTVLGCSRYAEGAPALTQGDAVAVVVPYAVQCIHGT